MTREADRRHSQYRKVIFRSLSIEGYHQHYLKILPWQKLLASQNNQAFITMMGFDCESFHRLLDMFAPEFNGHTPFDELGYIVEFKYTRG
jgi:hypothetical protein